MAAVSVVVTGFGSFNGVPSNPTQRLVAWLEQQYGPGSGGAATPDAAGACAPPSPPPARPLRHGRVHSCTILKVSGAAVRAFFEGRLRSELRRLAEGPLEPAPEPSGGAGAADAGAGEASEGAGEGPEQPRVVLLLHFGVDVHRPWFNLETRAVNNATFRSPDEDGWLPDACPVASDRAVDEAATSDLDLARLGRALRGRGHDARLSGDAGRFICNFTYFSSIQAAREASEAPAPVAAEGEGEGALRAAPAAGRRLAVHSLFVHVPPFDAVPEARQRRFAVDLIEAACDQLRRLHHMAPAPMAAQIAAAPLRGPTAGGSPPVSVSGASSPGGGSAFSGGLGAAGLGLSGLSLSGSASDGGSSVGSAPPQRPHHSSGRGGCHRQGRKAAPLGACTGGASPRGCAPQLHAAPPAWSPPQVPARARPCQPQPQPGLAPLAGGCHQQAAPFGPDPTLQLVFQQLLSLHQQQQYQQQQQQQQQQWHQPQWLPPHQQWQQQQWQQQQQHEQLWQQQWQQHQLLLKHQQLLLQQQQQQQHC